MFLQKYFGPTKPHARTFQPGDGVPAARYTRDPVRKLRCAWVGALGVVLASCANVPCSLNSDCPAQAHCVMNQCTRDCVEDRDCLDGQRCNVNGLCVGPDGGAAADVKGADAGDESLASWPDAGPARDVPTPPMDVPAPTDLGVRGDLGTPTDLGTPVDLGPPADLGVPPNDTGSTDLGTPPRDVVVVPDVPAPVDAGSPMSDAAVPVGVYEFTGVRPTDLVSPVAVAFHPSGSYALILAAVDRVYRYTPAGDALTVVSSQGSTVQWQTLSFTPDGAHAVLLANSGTGTARHGRSFLWTDATSTVAERTADAYNTGIYQDLRYRGDGSRGAVLGMATSSITLWNLLPDGTRGGVIVARGMVANTGCNTLAWTVDGFGDPSIQVGCGVNTGGILAVTQLAGTPAIAEIASASSTGNVSQVASHPRVDLALAIGSSSQRVYRYARGSWMAMFASPSVRAAYGVTFNDTGARALVFGGFGYFGEFRTDLYTAADIVQTQLALDAAPYNQPSDATVTAVAWRPGCDGGLVVGGANTFAHQTAFVARFAASNGRACP